MHFSSSNGDIPQPELLTATKSTQITGHVHTGLVTYRPVTYVTLPFFKKLSPSASSTLVERDRSEDLYGALPIGIHLHPGRHTFDCPFQNQSSLSHLCAQ